VGRYARANRPEFSDTTPPSLPLWNGGSGNNFRALESQLHRQTAGQPPHSRQDDDKTNGMLESLLMHRIALTTLSLQLTKEDEAAVGEEVQVRREDQDKINRFSRLHQRELTLQEELKLKMVRDDTRLPLAHTADRVCAYRRRRKSLTI
jgi:hypothetical protein